LATRNVFINGISALLEAYEKAGKGEEGKQLVREFLSQTFASDLDAKVERFRSLPAGIFDASSPYFRIFWEFNQIYIAGLYYSTVVTAGVICERVCLDILERNTIKHKKTAGLAKLIQLVSKHKLAKQESITEMKKIHKKRNEYVHPNMTATNNEKDALDMVKGISIVLRNECRAIASP
jgi:hypothetical protein